MPSSLPWLARFGLIIFEAQHQTFFLNNQVSGGSTCVKELTSTSSWEQGPSVEEEAQHEVVGSTSSIASSFTSTCCGKSHLHIKAEMKTNLVLVSHLNDAQVRL